MVDGGPLYNMSAFVTNVSGKVVYQLNVYSHIEVFILDFFYGLFKLLPPNTFSVIMFTNHCDGD